MEPKYGFRLAFSEEDECYIARCPEFEGVVGHGDTALEALREAEVSLRAALASYLDKGWAVPEAEAVPEFSGQIRLRMPRTLHRNLSEGAAWEGVSLNQHMIALLASRQERHDLKRLLKEALASRPAASISGGSTMQIGGRLNSGAPGTLLKATLMEI